jgi:hypothetical protein
VGQLASDCSGGKKGAWPSGFLGHQGRKKRRGEKDWAGLLWEMRRGRKRPQGEYWDETRE